ncbi:hypothetical protein NECAME_15836 [Necator americanus]|uniref:Uncharacterized protein n=1 Tax=Necator americanus TaxID=51031 RepID=W2SFV2_NECAM|nr:hypothetical protein NECAME_15836 [Necator americanus]ETN68408.1 hypothetical protein NECAME_15836 [Necator americanus]
MVLRAEKKSGKDQLPLFCGSNLTLIRTTNRASCKLNREEHDDRTAEVLAKRRLGFDAIRKRWHNLYLNSLCLQCRIEEAINRFQCIVSELYGFFLHLRAEI